MKLAVIVDSTAYLLDEFAENPDVYQVDLAVQFNDGSVQIDTSNKQEVQSFYDKLQQSDHLPTTSQPPLGMYYELMDQLIETGYTHALFIVLSSQISGTYQTAHMVAEEYSDRLTTYVVDSKSASGVTEYLARATFIFKDEGQSFDEIVKNLEWLVGERQIYLMVDDLNNLVKGGRLKQSEALLGGLLRIRPLLYFDEAGEIKLFEKIRSDKRVYKRWLQLIDEAIEKYPQGIHIALAHGDDYEGIEEVRQLISEHYPDHYIRVALLGPVVGTHTGRKSKGMGIFPNLERKEG
ncbi:DegV family protein [Dolosicoccus paucivorans]